ncbi:ArsR family transcriptional regulator [Thermococcus sp. M39]|uniref:transcriptional regulator n=1 Tax=unclassified Thermococcus TaxID=2627626 RepID=UPI00143B18AD|nr:MULTISPECIES: transcriptional regulator [unclassified Thermococcus]NJE08434.1 ArsR family transcriptional regulator [Thermococcus sp. M39]NJE11937.1 ArsR family transcriptional regulator [Thermococcus sp. LS2]
MLRELVKNHVLGNPIRLGIMLYLLPRGKVLFKELQKVLDVTPGNLDSHLKTLEKAGYVKLTKVFADRPRTAIEITNRGAEETGKYLRMLKDLLNQI